LNSTDMCHIDTCADVRHLRRSSSLITSRVLDLATFPLGWIHGSGLRLSGEREIKTDCSLYLIIWSTGRCWVDHQGFLCVRPRGRRGLFQQLRKNGLRL